MPLEYAPERVTPVQRMKTTIRRFILRIGNLIHYSYQISSCQLCQATEVAMTWYCPSCGRPICLNCLNEFMAVAKIPECFNSLCTGSIDSLSSTDPKVQQVQTEYRESPISLLPPTKLVEEIPASVYRISEVVEAIQRKNRFSSPLPIPVPQLLGVVYYGFWGMPVVSTSQVRAILQEVNISYQLNESELDALLQVLATKRLITRKQGGWQFPSNGFPFVYRPPRAPPLGSSAIIGLSKTDETSFLSNDIPDSTPTIGMNAERYSRPFTRMSQEELRFLSLLEGLTGVLAVDCIWDKDEGRLIFVVHPNDKDKIIGRGGTTIRRLREHFQKNIDIVDYPSNRLIGRRKDHTNINLSTTKTARKSEQFPSKKYTEKIEQ